MTADSIESYVAANQLRRQILFTLAGDDIRIRDRGPDFNSPTALRINPASGIRLSLTINRERSGYAMHVELRILLPSSNLQALWPKLEA